MDLLIRDGLLLPMTSPDHVGVGHLLVRDGRIAAIGPDAGAQGRTPMAVIDAAGAAVLPGFVQTHTHLGHSLFAGLAADGEVVKWKREHVWTLERNMNADMARAAARLGVAQLLLSGTTATLDMGTTVHAEALFEAARDLGMRLTAGLTVVDAPGQRNTDPRDQVRAALAESERLRKIWHGAADGRLRYAYVPYDVLSCTEELLIEIIGRARGAGCLLHSRAAETTQEVDKIRTRFGCDTIAHLHDIGLTGVDVVLAHCVVVTAREQKLLKETGTRVSHCPASNLRTAAAIAKIGDLESQGVHLSLGAGSAPVGGSLDIFQIMRLAGLLHRIRAGVAALSPYRLLEMATCGGAQALGLDAELGSLEVGKRADIVIVDLRGPHAVTGNDPLFSLVYGCSGADVRDVLIDGTPVVRGRRLVMADNESVFEEAERQATALHKRLD